MTLSFILTNDKSRADSNCWNVSTIQQRLRSFKQIEINEFLRYSFGLKSTSVTDPSRAVMESSDGVILHYSRCREFGFWNGSQPDGAVRTVQGGCPAVRKAVRWDVIRPLEILLRDTPWSTKSASGFRLPACGTSSRGTSNSWKSRPVV